MQTPTSGHWNSYWKRDQTERFTKISWSKKRIINKLSPYIQENKKALDAGCGSGFFSKYFCDQNMHTTALDYSTQALEIARKITEGRVQTVQKDLLNDNIAQDLSDRFSLIFSDGLFEHFSLTDQDKILQNFINVLDDDGVIVTFVPNRWSPWELIRPFYMPGIEEDPFVLSELKQLHARNGLTIVEQGGLNTFPFALSPDRFLGSTFGMLLYVVARRP